MAAFQVSGPTILIVDDDTNQCDLYALMLRALSWSVTTVSSSREAWSLLLDHPPVLILSDVLMPGLSGLDLLHRIRDDEHLRSMKVILMTVVPEQVGSADAALA